MLSGWKKSQFFISQKNTSAKKNKQTNWVLLADKVEKVEVYNGQLAEEIPQLPETL